MRFFCAAILFSLCSFACSGNETPSSQVPVNLQVSILEDAPHLPSSFTQGLEMVGDNLVESSGLYGKSFLYEYSAKTNQTLRKLELPSSRFAEGITVFDNKLYLLNWKAEKADVFDYTNFKKINTFDYQGEGWGLTHNETHLIMSNGSEELQFINPEDFSLSHTLKVYSENVNSEKTIWRRLNELEYADGLIWANIWQSSQIIAIDPNLGVVTAIADLNELVRLHNKMPGHDVLNGIAYNPKDKSFWLTGKLWPKRYKVRFKYPDKVTD